MLHQITSVNEIEQYFLRYSPVKISGETYTLTRMHELMRRFGNPQDRLRIIHVAGTSGKTSTSYYIRALLEEAGQSTGLTVSPHITSINERVQLNGLPITDEKFIAYVNRFIEQIAQWPDLQMTYFELIIALAYWILVQEKVDYAVIEVGLGGLLDATNVVTRDDKVCVLTPIGLDHTNVLGSTEAEIATQKAGIIGKNQAVFTANQRDDVASVIRHTATRNHAILHPILNNKLPPLPLPPFQMANFALAFTVFSYIQGRDNLPQLKTADITHAATLMPPGRFEVIRLGTKTIILDGAHNPQKLSALMDALKTMNISTPVWLVGFIEAPETKIIDCMNIINKQPSDVICTEFQLGQDLKNRKSVPAQHVAEYLSGQGSNIIISPEVESALQIALNHNASTIVVTGSLYLVSLVRRAIKKRIDTTV